MQRAASVLRGHLEGCSRKGKTRMDLTRSLAKQHCALKWSPRVLHRRVLLKPSVKHCFSFYASLTSVAKFFQIRWYTHTYRITSK